MNMLGAPKYTVNSPGSVRGKFPSIHPGDVLVSLVLHAGGWLRVHGLGLVHAVPLK
jgi:hypothetical protein